MANALKNATPVGRPQRFGRVVKSFGDFGELRKQKKAPYLEVLYIPVKVPNPGSPVPDEVLRSVNNCTNDQISDFIRKVGIWLPEGTISQENAEFLLDRCYAELNERLNHEATQATISG